MSSPEMGKGDGEKGQGSRRARSDSLWEGRKRAERVKSNKSLKIKFAKQSESGNRDNQEVRRDDNKVFR